MRSSSLLSPQQRNTKKYSNNYKSNDSSKKFDKNKKGKFCRVSSTSSLFNRNYNHYLLNHIKSISISNNKGNKKPKQFYSIYNHKI
jgi:hypothetical protein